MPVDSFAPNPWGRYQMHGNVWQWVEDCYEQGYKGAPADGSAKQDGDCSLRVIRGGSWNSYPGRLRAAGRDSSVPGSRYSDHGFRVARTLRGKENPIFPW
jgi:formylglycine-generating enzyme required for sulfatase activity